jgi:hypothetical protein
MLKAGSPGDQGSNSVLWHLFINCSKCHRTEAHKILDASFKLFSAIRAESVKCPIIEDLPCPWDLLPPRWEKMNVSFALKKRHRCIEPLPNRASDGLD